MALLSKYIPTFDNVSDEELLRRLHCWEHCALVSVRSQRQVARMHVRCLREEIGRREAARMLAGNVSVMPVSDARLGDSLPKA